MRAPVLHGSQFRKKELLYLVPGYAPHPAAARLAPTWRIESPSSRDPFLAGTPAVMPQVQEKHSSFPWSAKHPTPTPARRTGRNAFGLTHIDAVLEQGWRCGACFNQVSSCGDPLTLIVTGPGGTVSQTIINQ
jgi:hypothetical protein